MQNQGDLTDLDDVAMLERARADDPLTEDAGSVVRAQIDHSNGCAIDQ